MDRVQAQRESGCVMNQTILLVEDNPGDQLLFRLALQDSQVMNPIMVLEDGTDALDYLFARGKFAQRAANDLPVLVVLDLRLPKVDGLQVLRAIRADPRTARLGVI